MMTVDVRVSDAAATTQLLRLNNGLLGPASTVMRRTYDSLRAGTVTVAPSGPGHCGGDLLVPGTVLRQILRDLPTADGWPCEDSTVALQTFLDRTLRDEGSYRVECDEY